MLNYFLTMVISFLVFYQAIWVPQLLYVRCNTIIHPLSIMGSLNNIQEGVDIKATLQEYSPVFDARVRKRGAANPKNLPPSIRSRVGGNRGKDIFKRFNRKRKYTAEFVSLRCGIGAHWEAHSKMCVPHKADTEEKPSEELTDSDEMIVNPADNTKRRDNENNSPEIVTGHIVSVYCGIGYSYNKADSKCIPLHGPDPDSGTDSSTTP